MFKFDGLVSSGFFFKMPLFSSYRRDKKNTERKHVYNFGLHCTYDRE